MDKRVAAALAILITIGTFYLAVIDPDIRKTWGQVVIYLAGGATGLATPPLFEALKKKEMEGRQKDGE